MKKYLSLFVFLMLLAGCGSKTIPDWINLAYHHLDNFKKDTLEGKADTADLHFSRAIQEIKKSGDLDMLERAYLTKCALQSVLLEKIDDRDYLNVEALHPSPTNKSYHALLIGSLNSVDRNQLPDQYRSFYSALKAGKYEEAVDEIVRIEDPLSRLIAAGLMVRYGKPDERCLEVAIDTASQNGWKKALMVYLEKLQSLYESRKDMDKAANTKKKIELIKN
jgi:hypothetical protein